MTSAPGSWSPPVCKASTRAGCLKVQRRMHIQQHRPEVLPTRSSSRRSLVLPVVADPSPWIYSLLASTPTRLLRWGLGGAKQPHRRLAPSYARRGSPAQRPA
jgi:hypothetical protein